MFYTRIVEIFTFEFTQLSYYPCIGTGKKNDVSISISSVQRVAINISIRYGSKLVTYCCSYIFCIKTITCGGILEVEVSI